MSEQYDNTNSGALFRNDKKTTDKHPDYRGSLNVQGVEYWLSSWLKTARDGRKYMSLSVTPKEQQTAPAPFPQSAPEPEGDVPF